jgi:tetratricopeptide (TPR) repeat protein
VLFPFLAREVEIATGKVLNEFRTTSIVANRVYDPAVFSPPEFKRTPLQSWIENLYAMRDDAQAVMWTYHDFRRAHPDRDTHDGAQAAGYQILKMKEIPAAIALLEANARDYPGIAAAHFGLGRAYKTASETTKGKAELHRALALDPTYKRAAEMLKTLE